MLDFGGMKECRCTKLVDADGRQGIVDAVDRLFDESDNVVGFPSVDFVGVALNILFDILLWRRHNDLPRGGLRRPARFRLRPCNIDCAVVMMS